MTNAQILSNSFNEWASPIVAAAINGMAKQNQMSFFISNLISPDRIIGALQQHIAAPTIYKYVSKLPDEIIPEFALDVIDGMVEQRVKEGAIAIPFIGLSLGADAFRGLHEICASNFKEYGETPAPAPVEFPEVEPTTTI